MQIYTVGSSHYYYISECESGFINMTVAIMAKRIKNNFKLMPRQHNKYLDALTSCSAIAPWAMSSLSVV